MRELCGNIIEESHCAAMHVACFFVKPPPTAARVDGDGDVHHGNADEGVTDLAARKQELQAARYNLVRLLALAQALAMQACHRVRGQPQPGSHARMRSGTRKKTDLSRRTRRTLTHAHEQRAAMASVNIPHPHELSRCNVAVHSADHDQQTSAAATTKEAWWCPLPGQKIPQRGPN